MGNCCFSNKVGIEDNVVGYIRLIPEDKISLIYSEEFNCYMIKLDLANLEKCFFRFWPEGQRSSYVSDSSDYDYESDVPDYILINLAFNK